MCNRYRIEVEFDELWRVARPHRDMTNRANPTTEVFPDKPGPVVRNSRDGDRELINLTWGMPSPPTVTNGKPDYGVTNVRNLDSPHWRRWTSVEYRCIVPWTAFCEYEDTKPKKTARWFALDNSERIAFFRWHLDAVDGRARLNEEPAAWRARAVRISHLRGKRCRQTDPPESHARHPDRARGNRAMDERGMEGRENAAASASGRANVAVAG